MPELPEVEALAADLRERAAGRVIDRADIAEISVLKTYDPALSALRGRAITTTRRYGKFLDLVTEKAPADDACAGAPDGPLHLIVHLARAGWLRWREELPSAPPKPGKSPLAFRLTFDDGSGFDLTEAGTRKRLAVYLVRDPAEVPGVHARPRPAGRGLHRRDAGGPALRAQDAGQGGAPRSADHRGHRQRLLR